MEEFLEQVEKVKGELKIVKRAHKKIENDCQKLENDISAIESMVNKLKDVRGQITRQAQVEQVDLPTQWKGDSGDKRKRRGQKSDANKRRRLNDGESQPIDGEYPDDITAEIEYDFSSFEDEEPISNLQEYERQKGLLRKKIDTIATSLSKLAPNLKAIERFNDIKGRLANVTKAFSEAKKKVEDARDEFRKVENQRVERFMRAFKHVEGHISIRHLPRLDKIPTLPNGRYRLPPPGKPNRTLHGWG